MALGMARPENGLVRVRSTPTESRSSQTEDEIEACFPFFEQLPDAPNVAAQIDSARKTSKSSRQRA